MARIKRYFADGSWEWIDIPDEQLSAKDRRELEEAEKNDQIPTPTPPTPTPTPVSPQAQYSQAVGQSSYTPGPGPLPPTQEEGLVFLDPNLADNKEDFAPKKDPEPDPLLSGPDPLLFKPEPQIEDVAATTQKEVFEPAPDNLPLPPTEQEGFQDPNLAPQPILSTSQADLYKDVAAAVLEMQNLITGKIKSGEPAPEIEDTSNANELTYFPFIGRTYLRAGEDIVELEKNLASFGGKNPSTFDTYLLESEARIQEQLGTIKAEQNWASNNMAAVQNLRMLLASDPSSEDAKKAAKWLEQLDNSPQIIQELQNDLMALQKNRDSLNKMKDLSDTPLKDMEYKWLGDAGISPAMAHVDGSVRDILRKHSGISLSGTREQNRDFLVNAVAYELMRNPSLGPALDPFAEAITKTYGIDPRQVGSAPIQGLLEGLGFGPRLAAMIQNVDPVKYGRIISQDNMNNAQGVMQDLALVVPEFRGETNARIYLEDAADSTPKVREMARNAWKAEYGGGSLDSVLAQYSAADPEIKQRIRETYLKAKAAEYVDANGAGSVRDTNMAPTGLLPTLAGLWQDIPGKEKVASIPGFDKVIAGGKMLLDAAQWTDQEVEFLVTLANMGADKLVSYVPTIGDNDTASDVANEFWSLSWSDKRKMAREMGYTMKWKAMTDPTGYRKIHQDMESGKPVDDIIRQYQMPMVEAGGQLLAGLVISPVKAAGVAMTWPLRATRTIDKFDFWKFGRQFGDEAETMGKLAYYQGRFGQNMGRLDTAEEIDNILKTQHNVLDATGNVLRQRGIVERGAGKVVQSFTDVPFVNLRTKPVLSAGMADEWKSLLSQVGGMEHDAIKMGAILGHYRGGGGNVQSLSRRAAKELAITHVGIDATMAPGTRTFYETAGVPKIGSWTHAPVVRAHAQSNAIELQNELGSRLRYSGSARTKIAESLSSAGDWLRYSIRNEDIPTIMRDALRIRDTALTNESVVQWARRWGFSVVGDKPTPQTMRYLHLLADGWKHGEAHELDALQRISQGVRMSGTSVAQATMKGAADNPAILAMETTSMVGRMVYRGVLNEMPVRKGLFGLGISKVPTLPSVQFRRGLNEQGVTYLEMARRIKRDGGTLDRAVSPAMDRAIRTLAQDYGRSGEGTIDEVMSQIEGISRHYHWQFGAKKYWAPSRQKLDPDVLTMGEALSQSVQRTLSWGYLMMPRFAIRNYLNNLFTTTALDGWSPASRFDPLFNPQGLTKHEARLLKGKPIRQMYRDLGLDPQFVSGGRGLLDDRAVLDNRAYWSRSNKDRNAFFSADGYSAVPSYQTQVSGDPWFAPLKNLSPRVWSRKFEEAAAMNITRQAHTQAFTILSQSSYDRMARAMHDADWIPDLDIEGVKLRDWLITELRNPDPTAAYNVMDNLARGVLVKSWDGAFVDTNLGSDMARKWVNRLFKDDSVQGRTQFENMAWREWDNHRRTLDDQLEEAGLKGGLSDEALNSFDRRVRKYVDEGESLLNAKLKAEKDFAQAIDQAVLDKEPVRAVLDHVDDAARSDMAASYPMVDEAVDRIVTGEDPYEVLADLGADPAQADRIMSRVQSGQKPHAVINEELNGIRYIQFNDQLTDSESEIWMANMEKEISALYKNYGDPAIEREVHEELVFLEGIRDAGFNAKPREIVDLLESRGMPEEIAIEAVSTRLGIDPATLEKDWVKELDYFLVHGEDTPPTPVTIDPAKTVNKDLFDPALDDMSDYTPEEVATYFRERYGLPKDATEREIRREILREQYRILSDRHGAREVETYDTITDPNRRLALHSGLNGKSYEAKGRAKLMSAALVSRFDEGTSADEMKQAVVAFRNDPSLAKWREAAGRGSFQAFEEMTPEELTQLTTLANSHGIQGEFTTQELRELLTFRSDKDWKSLDRYMKGTPLLGMGAGIEIDEEGNYEFDPARALLGMGIGLGIRGRSNLLVGRKTTFDKLRQFLKGDLTPSSELATKLSSILDELPTRDLNLLKAQGLLKDTDEGLMVNMKVRQWETTLDKFTKRAGNVVDEAQKASEEGDLQALTGLQLVAQKGKAKGLDPYNTTSFGVRPSMGDMKAIPEGYARKAGEVDEATLERDLTPKKSRVTAAPNEARNVLMEDRGRLQDMLKMSEDSLKMLGLNGEDLRSQLDEIAQLLREESYWDRSVPRMEPNAPKFSSDAYGSAGVTPDMKAPYAFWKNDPKMAERVLDESITIPSNTAYGDFLDSSPIPGGITVREAMGNIKKERQKIDLEIQSFLHDYAVKAQNIFSMEVGITPDVLLNMPDETLDLIGDFATRKADILKKLNNLDIRQQQLDFVIDNRRNPLLEEIHAEWLRQNEVRPFEQARLPFNPSDPPKGSRLAHGDSINGATEWKHVRSFLREASVMRPGEDLYTYQARLLRSAMDARDVSWWQIQALETAKGKSLTDIQNQYRKQLRQVHSMLMDQDRVAYESGIRTYLSELEAEWGNAANQIIEHSVPQLKQNLRQANDLIESLQSSMNGDSDFLMTAMELDKLHEEFSPVKSFVGKAPAKEFDDWEMPRQSGVLSRYWGKGLDDGWVLGSRPKDGEYLVLALPRPPAKDEKRVFAHVVAAAEDTGASVQIPRTKVQLGNTKKTELRFASSPNEPAVLIYLPEAADSERLINRLEGLHVAYEGKIPENRPKLTEAAFGDEKRVTSLSGRQGNVEATGGFSITDDNFNTYQAMAGFEPVKPGSQLHYGMRTLDSGEGQTADLGGEFSKAKVEFWGTFQRPVSAVQTEWMLVSPENGVLAPYVQSIPRDISEITVTGAKEYAEVDNGRGRIDLFKKKAGEDLQNWAGKELNVHLAAPVSDMSPGIYQKVNGEWQKQGQFYGDTSGSARVRPKPTPIEKPAFITGPQTGESQPLTMEIKTFRTTPTAPTGHRAPVGNPGNYALVKQLQRQAVELGVPESFVMGRTVNELREIVFLTKKWTVPSSSERVRGLANTSHHKEVVEQTHKQIDNYKMAVAEARAKEEAILQAAGHEPLHIPGLDWIDETEDSATRMIPIDPNKYSEFPDLGKIDEMGTPNGNPIPIDRNKYSEFPGLTQVDETEDAATRMIPIDRETGDFREIPAEALAPTRNMPAPGSGLGRTVMGEPNPRTGEFEDITTGVFNEVPGSGMNPSSRVPEQGPSSPRAIPGEFKDIDQAPSVPTHAPYGEIEEMSQAAPSPNYDALEAAELAKYAGLPLQEAVDQAATQRQAIVNGARTQLEQAMGSHDVPANVPVTGMVSGDVPTGPIPSQGMGWRVATLAGDRVYLNQLMQAMGENPERLVPNVHSWIDGMEPIVEKLSNNLFQDHMDAMRVAKRMSDYALHNYQNTSDFDAILKWLIPWHFWTTRSSIKYMERMLDKPENFSRIFQVFGLQGALSNEEGLPESIQKKLEGRFHFPLDINAFGYQIGMPGAKASIDARRLFFPMDLLGFGEPIQPRSDLYAPGRDNLSEAGKAILLMNQFTGGLNPFLDFLLKDGMLPIDPYSAEYRSYLEDRGKDSFSVPLLDVLNRVLWQNLPIDNLGPVPLDRIPTRDFRTAENVLLGKMHDGSISIDQYKMALLELKQGQEDQSIWGGRLGIRRDGLQLGQVAQTALDEARRVNFTSYDGFGALTGLGFSSILPGQIEQAKYDNVDQKRLLFNQYGKQIHDYFVYNVDGIVVERDSDNKPITRKLSADELRKLVFAEETKLIDGVNDDLDVQAAQKRDLALGGGFDNLSRIRNSDKLEKQLAGYMVGDSLVKIKKNLAINEYFAEINQIRNKELDAPLEEIKGLYGENAAQAAKLKADFYATWDQKKLEAWQKIGDKYKVDPEVVQPGTNQLDDSWGEFYGRRINAILKPENFLDQDGVIAFPFRTQMKKKLLTDIVPPAARKEVEEWLVRNATVDDLARDVIEEKLSPYFQLRKEAFRETGEARTKLLDKLDKDFVFPTKREVIDAIKEHRPELTNAYIYWALRHGKNDTEAKALLDLENNPDYLENLINSELDGLETFASLDDYNAGQTAERLARLKNGTIDRFRLANGVVVSNGKSWKDIEGKEHSSENNLGEFLRAFDLHEQYIKGLDSANGDKDKINSLYKTFRTPLYEKYYGAGPIAARVLEEILKIQDDVDAGYKAITDKRYGDVQPGWADKAGKLQILSESLDALRNPTKYLATLATHPSVKVQGVEADKQKSLTSTRGVAMGEVDDPNRPELEALGQYIAGEYKLNVNANAGTVKPIRVPTQPNSGTPRVSERGATSPSKRSPIVSQEPRNRFVSEGGRASSYGGYTVTDRSGNVRYTPSRVNDDPGNAVKSLITEARWDDYKDRFDRVKDLVTGLYGFPVPAYSNATYLNNSSSTRNSGNTGQNDNISPETMRQVRDQRFGTEWPDINHLLYLAEHDWPTKEAVKDDVLRFALQRGILRNLVNGVRLKEGYNALGESFQVKSGPLVDPVPNDIPRILSHSFVERNPDFRAIRDLVMSKLGYPDMGNWKSTSELPLADRQWYSSETWRRFSYANPEIAGLLLGAEKRWDSENKFDLSLQLLNQLGSKLGWGEVSQLGGTPYRRQTYYNRSGGIAYGGSPSNVQELLEDYRYGRISYSDLTRILYGTTNNRTRPTDPNPASDPGWNIIRKIPTRGTAPAKRFQLFNL